MASPLQVADAGQQRVGRRPQTSEPPVGGGPFLRHTRTSRVQGFNSAGNAFGGLVNLPLKAVPGYLRYLDLATIASGGTGAVAVGAADAPYNSIQQILFKDAFGQPIIQGGGFEILKLVAMYSGQHGFFQTADPNNLPSFAPVAATGNFTFRSRIPLELFDGFCAIAGANASATPSITLTLNTTAQVYSVVPTGAPTLTTEVQEAYYAVPLDDPSMGPPDNGSSHQWSQATVPIQVASASNTNLILPPLGSFVTTLIFVFRDSTGARNDAILPAGTSAIEFWVDGVPLYIEDLGTRTDLMFQQFGVNRPAGVLVYTFRDSVATFGGISAIDTADLYLPTTPGTLLELRSAAWGTFANSPATVTLLSGRVYAAGGIPYTHLAD